MERYNNTTELWGLDFFFLYYRPLSKTERDIRIHIENDRNETYSAFGG